MTEQVRVPELGAPRPFAFYDKRNYKTVGVEEGYAGWSRVYAEQGFDDRYDIDLLEHGEPLLDALEEPGVRVIDLGCGTGRIGRWVHGRAEDAHVVGVDRTPEMLAHAAEGGGYASLEKADMSRVAAADGSFDVAISSMATCHVHDLEAFYHEAMRLVRVGGVLAVVDFHPFMLMQGIPSHFQHPESGEDVAVENAVHGLSQHFMAAREAGWACDVFLERFVTPEWVEATPEYAKYAGAPLTFLMVFQ